MARLARSIAKRHVRRYMARAPFLKCPAAAIPFVFKLGMVPRVIAVYRDFGEIARSKMVQYRASWPTVADRLLMTYSNALIAIHSFGGCAISYEEMIDQRETAWIDALAACTGLDAGAIAEARARLVVPRAPCDTPPHRLDLRLDHVYADLKALRGRYLPPSQQFLEQLARNNRPRAAR